MNKTNVRRLAMALLTGELTKRKKPVGYNQRTYLSSDSAEFPDNSGHYCGTVACIAGTAAILHGYRPRNGNNGITFSTRASEFLGIRGLAARELFNYRPLESEPSAKQAALVLFHLAETGIVDWTVARNA